MAKAIKEVDIVAGFRGQVQMFCPRVRVVAVPNAGKRSQWAAIQAKREGMATGFPDLICLWPNGLCFIEMKRPGGPVRESQREWIDALSEMGFRVTIARSSIEAMHFLKDCGAPFLFEYPR